MENIKFRGKRIDTKEWVYGYYYPRPVFDGDGIYPSDHIIVDDRTIATEHIIIDPETIGQFTGLQDKKGKDIYEDADIKNPSRNGGEPHKVVFSDKFGGWVGLYGGLAYLIAQELHEIEVIG